MMNSISQEDHIHPICSPIVCNQILNRRNIYCLLFWVKTRHHIYRQTEGKFHLHSVINPMKFVETLFQLTVCHQLSIVPWIMSVKLHKYQCCLLSSSRSDVVWGSVVLLTTCPQQTGLTHLLAMIDWLTCYWSYDAPWDHLLTNLNVTHFLYIMGWDCWWQKEALLTNCCHQIIHISDLS